MFIFDWFWNVLAQLGEARWRCTSESLGEGGRLPELR
jgi:hypothetical protein